MVINTNRCSRKDKGIPLLRYFVIVSLIAIGVILLLEGFGLQAVFENYVTAGAERDAVRLAKALSELESGMLVHAGPDGKQVVKVLDPDMLGLDRQMRGFLSQFGVVKIKVFDASARIVYSTDPQIIGNVDSENQKLQSALSGHVMSKYETIDHVWDIQAEYRPNVDVVETYVPIRGTGGEVVGSFEIYKDVTGNLGDARVMLRRSVTLMGMVLFIVFGVLCGLMYIASRTILHHQFDLQASEARTRVIVEEAADAIMTVDDSGVIESFNTAAEKIFGVPRDRMTGQGFSRILHIGKDPMPDEESVHGCEQIKAVTVHEGGVEGTGRRCDGTIFPTWLTVTEVRFADEVLYTVIVRDLTEQKRRELRKREEDLKRADQMEMIAQLATGVAHELRNPLTAVKLFFQNNKEEALSLGMSVDDLEVVEYEIRRMERSLSTFLDFARPSKPKLKSFDLRQVIDRAAILVEGRAARQQVACLKFIEVSDAVPVLGDQDQLQQLILNLCMNALDAMSDGGTLELHVDVTKGRQVEVRVTDTGPGIQETVMSRLFEPFVTTKEGGTGLGLVISRRIAKSHGGKLTCFNQPGAGACFVLELPIHERNISSTYEA